MNSTIFSLAELAALSIEPSWADLDPARNRVLIVDLRRDAPVDRARLHRWLTSQVVPVIGIESTSPSDLGDAMDLLVTESEVDRAVGTVERNPVASSVLVQVLRSVERLSIDEGLAFESMAYATLQCGCEFAEWLAAHRAAHPAPRARAADEIVVVRREGNRLDIELNDPDSRNALSASMRDAMTDAFKLVLMDESIATVRVSGQGPCFSSGGDLHEFGTLTDAAEAHRIRMLRMPARYLAARSERYTFRVHRACIGAGIELPAFAGRIVATPNTFFQLPEVSMGLIPGAGGCVSIPRRIGRQRTAYMALLGERISAERALAWGLIDAIEK